MVTNVLDVGNSSLTNFSHDKLKFLKVGRDSLEKPADLIVDLKEHYLEFLEEYIEATDLVLISIGYNPEREGFSDTSDEQDLEVFDLNYFIPMKVMKLAVKYNKPILVLSSKSANSTYPGHAQYSAAKSALTTLVKNIKGEGYHKIHSLEPDMIQTKMSKFRGSISPEDYFYGTIYPLINLMISDRVETEFYPLSDPNKLDEWKYHE